jgi:hypothetical protein
MLEGPMTTYTHLRQLFADIAIGALALQAGACSSSHDLDRAGSEETPCDTTAHLAAVAFASETDYLAIRRIVLDVEGNVDPQQTPQVEPAVGVPCRGAPDPDACDAAFEALPLQPGFEQASFFERSHYQLLWTRGDEAGVVTNTAELQRFLGTIESPEQAALIVRFATGSRLACDGANTRVIDGGVEVITNSGTTCGEGTALYESLLRINADGTVTEVRTVVVEVGDPNCVIGRLTEGLAGPEGAQHADLGS